ncbi:HEAT repeat protein [Ichthyophthirius multifiliis]|uniref:HEAT repeat protein n=1 Tax=Ichthyophthirius multifiliis TaxID=5932 RepID=G0QKS8_ICHMU|nr:HEAT repeat protein [Ichthyophthirius multifiliis]EGR34180.1 HEAT repeat protein [Ichthyophthirius multifiliis]|eukprot:XP_004039484.1 HEAT repeat protein [Ichthyophthirius multifiliis]
MVYSSLEIIALIGPHNISYNNIKLLASILIDEALPVLQDKAFLALINLDYPGFYALLDIANKDFNDIPLYIQNKFAQTEEIQLLVIIPSLLNDINTGDMKKKIQSLCALNRMYSLIYKANGLPLLVNILNEGNIDRQLIVSVIRACGEIGEQTLLKILKSSPNYKIKIAITTVLSWRVQKQEKNKLKIKIVPYSVAQHYNVNPGTMCIYIGDQTPLAFIDQIENNQEQEEYEEPYIEINTRDFMAALQRLMAIKYDKFQREFDDHQQMHDYSQFINQFTLAKLIDPLISQQEQNEDVPSISLNIIKCLCNLINEENHQVREAAVNTLGLIGLPEAKQAIEPLYNALNDPESQVRAMSAWCLGRLGEANPLKVAKRLINLLKDNYWKVRTAACVSLGSIGHNIQNIAFPALTKALRDGTINKLTICETLVRLGVYGEQILIDLLKNVPQSNFKLKTAIIQSFEIANVQSPRIDFIIEELFRNASDQMIEVRKACLQTLEVLRNRAQDSNITYLKSRNVLPLFYFFLQDSSSEIRKIAIESIQSYGPQAELMFIEGLTKDKNHIIRSECAKGLGQLGVQNFRALLFGLRDANQNVRRQTSLAITQNFQPEMIIEEFAQKVNQIPALLCNIKDILSLPFMLDQECKNILEFVLQAFGESPPENQNQQYSQQQQV